MNYTVYAVGLNGTENDGRTSINIKNNTENSKTQGVGFEGVIVSGMSVDGKAMDENTYKSLLEEADDVKQQIMSSATDAKANLKALFNRLSGADAVRIDEDGFNLNEATPEDMVNIVDRIKIELAAHSDSYAVDLSGIDISQIKQVVGSEIMAQQVAAKMQEAGLPLTGENINAMAGALEGLEQKEISESAKNYLVENKLEPTINNIKLAESASNKSGAGKETLTDEQWKQLLPQAEKVMESAGLDANEKNIENAKTFIENGIPVTEKNLLYKNQLDELTLDFAETAEKIAEGMAQGQQAQDVSLVRDYDAAAQVAHAMDTVMNVGYEEVLYATERHGADVSIRTLEEACEQLKQAQSADTGKTKVGFTSGEAAALPLENSSEDSENGTANNAAQETDLSGTVRSNYRMLLEVRILMTAQSGMYLYRSGVSIQTVSIGTLHEHLLAYDEEQAMERIARQLSENIDGDEAGRNSGEAAVQYSEENSVYIEMYQLSFAARRAALDIAYAPDVSVGAVYKQSLETGVTMNLESFADTGRNLRERFRQANETYEAVGTAVRRDMGDSLSKAVDLSAAGILDSLGLSDSRANRDAVRILSYNNIDVTEKNIEQIKYLHAELNSLIENMKPDAVLDMIRENINPLTADIETVNKYLKEKNEQSDNSDKYSTFLYKLDRTNGISEEERRTFIGIYKMINMYRKDAGNAIGALVKQGADITMENLCRAYDSRRLYNMDTEVSDDTDIVSAQAQRYYLNMFEAAGPSVTPLTLREVNREEAVLHRTVENFCESIQEAYSAEAEAEYMDAYMELVRAVADADNDVLRELEQAGQPVNINNIEAMQALMYQNAYGSILGNSQQRVSRIIDSIESSRELERAFAELGSESAEEVTDTVSPDYRSENARGAAGSEPENSAAAEETLNAVNESEPVDTYESVHEALLKNRVIKLLQNMSSRRDYRIPFLSGDGVGVMRLMLVSDDDEKGKISVSYKDEVFGEVSAEIKVRGRAADIYGMCSSGFDSFDQKIKAAAENLKEKFGLDEVRTFNAQADHPADIYYEEAGEATATPVLYRMAKNFISDCLK